MIVALGWLAATTAGVLAVVHLLLASARLGPPPLIEGEAFDGWPAAESGGLASIRGLLAQAGSRMPAGAARDHLIIRT